MNAVPGLLRNRGTFDALLLLTPYDTTSFNKIRLGPNHDGGYVVLDDLDRVSVLYSYGIGSQVELEEEFASRGKICHMYDHTIAALPYERPEFRWRREGIAGHVAADQSLYTLEHHIASNGDRDRDDMFLKIDVEGAEYEAIINTPETVLSQFRQFTLEIHWLFQLSDDAFRSKFMRMLERVNSVFTLVHVHGNHCAPVGFVDGYAVADVLELTYVRSDLIEREVSSTVYPTPLDHANVYSQNDMLLWFFPFLPTGRSVDEVRASFGRSLVAASQTVSAYVPVYLEKERSRLLRDVATIDTQLDNLSYAATPYVGGGGGGGLRILYFSCHEILEFDDLKMFTDAGHTVFSIGSFMRPGTATPYRTALANFYDLEALAAWDAANFSPVDKVVTRDFVERFDVVMVNSHADWISANLDAFGNKPVIMRTVGQSSLAMEDKIRSFADRVTIVRYSEREGGGPGFARTDAVIYFAKDPSTISRWVGGGAALTLHHQFAQREPVNCPTLAQWTALAGQADLVLYGSANNGIPGYQGVAAPGEFAEVLSTCGCYFYIYTWPTSYTLSIIEAMTAGVPVIAPSARFVAGAASAPQPDDGRLWSQERYEVEELLRGGAGLVYDSMPEAAQHLRQVLGDPAVAATLSHNAVRRARDMFSPQKIGEQWTTLFLRLVSAKQT